MFILPFIKIRWYLNITPQCYRTLRKWKFTYKCPPVRYLKKTACWKVWLPRNTLLTIGTACPQSAWQSSGRSVALTIVWWAGWGRRDHGKGEETETQRWSCSNRTANITPALFSKERRINFKVRSDLYIFVDHTLELHHRTRADVTVSYNNCRNTGVTTSS